MLYRLTDPANGRTVCYVRSDEQKVAGMIGQFIGVKGEVTTDPSLGLKTVGVTDVEQVDPGQVFRGIGSEIVPPSLLPQATEGHPRRPKRPRRARRPPAPPGRSSGGPV